MDKGKKLQLGIHFATLKFAASNWILLGPYP